MGEGKKIHADIRGKGRRGGLFPRVIVSCCLSVKCRVKPAHPASYTRARKHTHTKVSLSSWTQSLGVKSYLSAQLRMVSVTFFCVSPSSGLVHRCVSWSTRFPGLSASTWTSGGGIITGRRAHTRTNTQAHAQKHRKQTKWESWNILKIRDAKHTFLLFHGDYLNFKWRPQQVELQTMRTHLSIYRRAVVFLIRLTTASQWKILKVQLYVQRHCPPVYSITAWLLWIISPF